MDKQQAKQILTSRKLVAGEGKTTLKVTNVNPFMRQLKDGSGSQLVHIVNFAAMTGYQFDKALALFKEGKYQEATNTNLSASQLSGQYVPSKGEIVDVEVTTVKNNDGIDILTISNITPRKAVESAKISASAFDDEETEETTSAENIAEVAAGQAETAEAKAEALGVEPEVI